MSMIIGLIFCTSDITQLVRGMSAHMSAQGAIVCFVVHSVCYVVHIVCQVDVIAYSLVLKYLQIFSTLNKNVFSSVVAERDGHDVTVANLIKKAS